MTAKIDFIGNLHNDWLESNIRKGFGPAPKNTTLFIARVLEVIEQDPERIKVGSSNPADFHGYVIRCRILSSEDYGGSKWEFEGPTQNPDAWRPDPCNWTEPTANAHIQSHPLYYPSDTKLKQPEPGDLVKVARNIKEDAEPGVVGQYTGFLVQTPPMDLQKPSARPKRRTPRKPPKKTTASSSTPPKQYKVKELAGIAEQAANAINKSQLQFQHSRAQIAKMGGKKSTSVVTSVVARENRKPSAPRQIVDRRLLAVFDAGMVDTGDVVGSFNFGIPDSWFDSSSPEFEAIADFISVVSDGYPGMPNTPTRKHLIRKVSKRKTAPPPNQFAKNSAYWKTWWFGGTKIRQAAPLNGNYRGLITTTTHLPEVGKQVRFGFGSFRKEDIPLYFPTFKDSKLGIKYAGAAGIGDPVCEMYALMMFIRVNFGSPTQFASMKAEARKQINSEDSNRHLNDKTKCLRGEGNIPIKIGDYKVDYTIMPKQSPYRCGMFPPYPPSDEI